MMPNKISGVDQFLHENLTWERALDFYLQENSYLKTRLSHVLDNNSDSDFITLAEHFQSSFIQNDENMKELKQDIIALQWNQPAACRAYLDNLFTDRGGARKGFPADVHRDLLRLRNFHCNLHLTVQE